MGIEDMEGEEGMRIEHCGKLLQWVVIIIPQREDFILTVKLFRDTTSSMRQRKFNSSLVDLPVVVPPFPLAGDFGLKPFGGVNE